MSITFCRHCRSSVNTKTCCGFETEDDEFFGLAKEILVDPIKEAARLRWDAYWAEVKSRPVEPSIFEKMERLDNEIESLGWQAFQAKENPEQAAILKTAIFAKELELKGLVAIRRTFL